MLIRNWCTVETSVVKARETLLKHTIHHASPRVDFYVQSLRHEFCREPRVQPSDPSGIQKFVATATKSSKDLKSWSDWAWKDYDFATDRGETYDRNRPLPEIDRLSCEAHEETDEVMRRDIK